ncbi:hypothetical protein DRN67_04465, partial [Candidatus Micrarchaeota archaeon]
GDSVKLKLPELKVEKVLKLEPGATCLVVKGKHAGKKVKLKEIRQGSESIAPRAALEDNGQEILTLASYLFVVGDEI